MSLENEVQAIPGSDGWWKESNFYVFHKYAERLQGYSMPDAEIIKMLTELYGAVAGEFGE